MSQLSTCFPFISILSSGRRTDTWNVVDSKCFTPPFEYIGPLAHASYLFTHWTIASTQTWFRGAFWLRPGWFQQKQSKWLLDTILHLNMWNPARSLIDGTLNIHTIWHPFLHHTTTKTSTVVQQQLVVDCWQHTILHYMARDLFGQKYDFGSIFGNIRRSKVCVQNSWIFVHYLETPCQHKPWMIMALQKPQCVLIS